MSLEQALQENTAALHKLIAVMQSGGLPVGSTATATATETATATATTTGKGTRGKKDTGTAAPSPTPAAAPAAGGSDATLNDGRTLSVKLREGDPEGTRYFHIEAHRTVAAVKPGEVIPSIGGMVEIDGTEYDTLKAKYAAPVPPSSGAAATGASAAAPASSTPSAPPASSPTSAPSPQAGSGATGDVMGKCVALHKLHGNDALAAVLLKHVGKDAKVPQLVAKTDAHAAAVADIDKLMALPQGAGMDAIKAALTPAAAAADNSSLFG